MLGLLVFACDRECGVEDAVCLDQPAEDDECEVAFSRWFYDMGSNSCSEITYSGCSEKGFATKAECEACDCK